MQRFAIQGYPHICHMRQGQTRDYVGDRSLEDVSDPLIRLLIAEFHAKLTCFGMPACVLQQTGLAVVTAIALWRLVTSWQNFHLIDWG